MARINSNTVVQLVGDDRIVIVDDSTGHEKVVPIADVPRLIEMLTYLHECAVNPGGQPEPRVIELEVREGEDFSSALDRTMREARWQI